MSNLGHLYTAQEPGFEWLFLGSTNVFVVTLRKISCNLEPKEELMQFNSQNICSLHRCVTVIFSSLNQTYSTLITWKKKYAVKMKSSCLKDQFCWYVHDVQCLLFQLVTWVLEHFFLKNQQEKMK